MFFFNLTIHLFFIPVLFRAMPKKTVRVQEAKMIRKIRKWEEAQEDPEYFNKLGQEGWKEHFRLKAYCRFGPPSRKVVTMEQMSKRYGLSGPSADF